jgi:hypothetical protein
VSSAASISTHATHHSDYIIYVDESGDHSLESIDSEFPTFVLSF